MAYGCSDTPDGGGFTGCGRRFGSLRDFDRHFVKVTRANDDARDRAAVGVDGKRCATDAELREQGLEPNATGVWRDPVSAEKVREAFAR